MKKTNQTSKIVHASSRSRKTIFFTYRTMWLLSTACGICFMATTFLFAALFGWAYVRQEPTCDLSKYEFVQRGIPHQTYSMVIVDGVLVQNHLYVPGRYPDPCYDRLASSNSRRRLEVPSLPGDGTATADTKKDHAIGFFFACFVDNAFDDFSGQGVSTIGGRECSCSCDSNKTARCRDLFCHEETSTDTKISMCDKNDSFPYKPTGATKYGGSCQITAGDCGILTQHCKPQYPCDKQNFYRAFEKDSTCEAAYHWAVRCQAWQGAKAVLNDPGVYYLLCYAL